MNSVAVFAHITGTVQGVNYRNATRRKAQELGVTGWVQNTPDGAVEALLRGAPDAVDALVSWCHQGPRRAVVKAVETREATSQQLDSLPASGFTVLR